MSQENPTPPAGGDEAFHRWLDAALRHSLKPTPEEMFALSLDALSEQDARRVREQLRQSPSALREYAQITDKSVAEVEQELAPEPGVIESLSKFAADVGGVIWRIARLTPSQDPKSALLFKGDGPQVDVYEVDGDPGASVVIEQAKVALKRHRVTGQVAFGDGERDTGGRVYLSLEGVPYSEGEVSSTGAFDLGVLSDGQYRLECVIGDQVIDVRPLIVGVHETP